MSVNSREELFAASIVDMEDGSEPELIQNIRPLEDSESLSVKSSLYDDAVSYSQNDSRYTGGFGLMSQLIFPRPCNKMQSGLIDLGEYYDAGEPLVVDIEIPGLAPFLGSSVYEKKPRTTFINGEDASSFFNVDSDGQVTFNTSAMTQNEYVGNQVVTMHWCEAAWDNPDWRNLYEATFSVTVLSNSYPDFVSELQTSFSLMPGDVFVYQMPDLVDPEGNDEPEVLITELEDREFPNFMEVSYFDRTLTFRPDASHAGETTYFTLIVKEKNSEVQYPYYCTVSIGGEQIVVEPETDPVSEPETDPWAEPETDPWTESEEDTWDETDVEEIDWEDLMDEDWMEDEEIQQEMAEDIAEQLIESLFDALNGAQTKTLCSILTTSAALFIALN